MSDGSQESEKRELQKLLREYDANSGMAGFVCSRPVELMPQEEQQRLIDGFCTSENLQVLLESKRKLEIAKSLSLSEDEAHKVERAIPTLEGLIEAFSAYIDSELSLSSLRERVRKLLHRPIPESQDGLIDSLSYLIDALTFLASQPLDTKDSWDKMVDCVQMYEALERVKRVCSDLQSILSSDGSPLSKRSQAIDETIDISQSNLKTLESFFRGEAQSESLTEHFRILSEDLKRLWSDDAEAQK